MTEAIRVELTAMESEGLATLIRQFTELLETGSSSQDSAIARLTPGAYLDDEEANREYRRLTEGDLIARRIADGKIVTDSLRPDADAVIALDVVTAEAWMRTLSAVRLVLAQRLDITTADVRDPEDSRYDIYDWVGYRLELLLQEMER